MPQKPPRICACGHRVANGIRCPCERKSDAERKARHDKNRKSSSARGYTGTWDKERKEFLKRHPRCKRCGGKADTVDHIIPHRGNSEIFWDRRNWAPLCTNCHSSAKQREERRSTKRT
ncbi:HNH endonuclease [Sedimentitalea todarodis]|uniref:Putative HNH nuclease YajD n=1 Tax=Sedimentitalea todarodis TaxID=1631240 RepID=A0ABU3VHX8_9RHOB|nr:HNH endonuclease [Sedimentitalea todarodis]MDU9005750.1 HNH endonuclease [Sedimentitalea todarodis]